MSRTKGFGVMGLVIATVVLFLIIGGGYRYLQESRGVTKESVDNLLDVVDITKDIREDGRQSVEYDYYQCENGIYYTYPRGLVDAGWTYHSSDGEKLADCAFFDSDETNEARCREIAEIAGDCIKKGF